MKTMCPPGYHHNGFVATHALGHMMRYMMPQSLCGDNWERTLFHDYIYYAHLASVRFEHSLCSGSLMTT